MTSIRTYTGTVYLCASCGQPSFEDQEVGPRHFREQWDGIHCARFPLAGQRIAVEWDWLSLQELKAKYPDTHPDRPRRRPEKAA